MEVDKVVDYHCFTNVLKRGTITYYSINFEQHKNFYDFFSSDILDSVIQSVYEKFTPDKECKF